MSNAGYYKGFGVEIEGLDEIERRLQQLPEKLRRKHIRKALKAGANKVRDEARRKARRAPVPTHPKYGHIADNIETKVFVKAKGAVAITGINWTTHSYGHLLEFGHRLPDGRTTRKFPFMRPAFDNKSDEAVETIVTDLRDAVEKEV